MLWIYLNLTLIVNVQNYKLPLYISELVSLIEQLLNVLYDGVLTLNMPGGVWLVRKTDDWWLDD